MGASAGPPPSDAPNFTLWAIIGIASFFVCANAPLGIIGGILAFMAKTEWEQGNYDGATGKMKISKILSLIGIILVGLPILIIVFVFFLGIGAAAVMAPTSY